jgi:hypothetical protein
MLRPTTRSDVDKAKALTEVAMQAKLDEVEAAHTAYRILRHAYACERDGVYHEYLREVRRQAE